MSNETTIRAWKDAKFRSSLNAKELAPNPAGDRLVEIDDAELRAVWGAVAEGQQPVEAAVPSQGYVCSVSGECNGTGQSCWS